VITDTPPRPAQAESPAPTNGHIIHSAPSHKEAPKPHTSPASTPTPASGRKWLLAIICVYVALCTLYNLLTPIGEGPDEPDHIRYVEYLVRFGDFPPIAGTTSSHPYTIEAKQPPVYYLLGASLMLALGREGTRIAPELSENPAFSRQDANFLKFQHPPVPADLTPWTHILRFLGALMGMGTILLTYATVRQVFPHERETPLAIGAAGIVALLPQFTFLSSVVNNDHFATLVGAAISYCMVRILALGATWRRALSLGALLGLALLSKNNNLVYIPVGLLVLALPGLPLFRGRSGFRPHAWTSFLRARLPLLALALVTCVVVGGWWMLRNLLVYGDLLARNAVNRMAAQAIPEQAVTANMSDPATLMNQFAGIMITHFAAFGWVVITPPMLWSMLYATLMLLATIGVIYDLLRGNLTGTQKACLVLGMLVFELFYAGLIYQVVWQGRLLFPALALTSLLLIRGTYAWLALLMRGRPSYALAAALWLVFLGAANVYSLLSVLVPAFHGKS
jgi:hypothetical protein